MTYESEGESSQKQNSLSFENWAVAQLARGAASIAVFYSSTAFLILVSCRYYGLQFSSATMDVLSGDVGNCTPKHLDDAKMEKTALEGFSVLI